MTAKGTIRFLLRLWIASMAWCCIAACNIIWSDEGLNPQSPEGVRHTITLNLAISHPDASIDTRAGLEYDDLTFTRNEAAVRNLTVFIVDLNQDGTENYDKIEHYSTEIDPIDFYSGIYIFSHTLEVETGDKHIYVGANLKAEHIEAFASNSPLALNGDGPAVNMVMTADPSHTGQGTDIAMFGQIKTQEGHTTISVDPKIRNYYLSGDLERLTAKVLLTCDEGEEGLVRTGGIGWLKTSDVRYTLNVTNKKTFISRHTDESGINSDPNWGLKSYVKEDNSGENGYIPVNSAAEFEYFSADDMIANLFDNRLSATALKYDSGRVGAGNSPAHYTEGLYCLENTVYNDMGITGTETDKAALHATTHLVIAVRYFPRSFVGGSSDNTQIDTYESIFDTYFVPGEDRGSGDHSAGTYWTREEDGKIIYYAWTGLKRKIEESNGTLKKEDFTCYEGGWSYFTTFVDGNATSDSKLTYADMDAWGVQRDHYYILAIDKITRPGSPVLWDDFIRINSITTEWVNRGSQEVTIRPTGE